MSCYKIWLKMLCVLSVNLWHTCTVYSRYITVGGVQAMVLWYRWERNISGNCHEPKSGSIFWRVVGDNGAFACFTANSGPRQWIWHLSKFDIALQDHVVEFPNRSHMCINNGDMYFAEIVVLPAILLHQRSRLQPVKPWYIQLSGYISGNLDKVFV